MDRTNSSMRVSMSAMSDTLLIQEYQARDEDEREGKRYLGVLHVSPKLRAMCSKYCCLSVSLVTFFILIVTIQLLIVNNPHKLASTCTVFTDKLESSTPFKYSHMILVAGSDGFGYLNLNENDLSILPSSKNVSSTFDVYSDDTIFFVDKDTRTIRSYPGEHYNIRYPRTWRIKSIASDFLSKKLYIVDSASKTLKVIDVQTHFYRTLDRNLENVTDLAVDPTSGLLFVSVRSDGIFCVAMDLTVIKMIALGRDISAMAVDRRAKIIFYATDYTSIANSDYDGLSHRTLTKVHTKVLSLAIREQRIFWSSEDSVHFCKLTNGGCDSKPAEIPLSNVRTIRTGFHRINMSNPCEMVPCDQLCLLAENRDGSSAGHSCVCADNWHVDVNGIPNTCTIVGVSRAFNYSQELFVAGTDGFSFLHLHEDDSHDLSRIPKAMRLADVYSADTIYWVDESTRTIRSFPSEHSKIRYPKSWNLTSIAADFVSEKLYLVDGVSKSLKVLDVSTRFYRTLAKDLENSSDLAVDPATGYLFVAKRFSGIHRIVMDGSLTTQIVSEQDVSTITVDRDARIIYYAADYDNIASTDYDGRNCKILTKISMKISSMALLADTIFWSTSESLYYCKVANRSCDKDNLNEISSANTTLLRTGSHRVNVRNPCDEDEASACDQLCLLTVRNVSSTANLDYKCACKDGWQLSEDAKSCEIIPEDVKLTDLEKMITLLDNDGRFWIVDPDREYRQRIQLPGTKERATGIVFEIYSNDNIVWCDEHTSTIKFLTRKHPDIRYPSGWQPTVLRVDHLANNIYILDGKVETINCISMDNGFDAVVLADIDSPRDFALDPELGLMFIVHSTDTISRASMSGAALSKIATVTTKITVFTLDRENQRIYYVVNGLKIESMDYSGSKRQTVVEVSNEVNSLTTLDGRLFSSDKHFGLSICKIGHCTYRSTSTTIDSPLINIRTMITLAKRRNAANPCVIHNCDQLCVLNGTKTGLSRVCACRTGWELQTNGRTCAPISSFMLYTRGNVIRGRVLDETRSIFTEAIQPTKFSVASLKFKDSIDFDYDWIERNFIFSDDYNVFVINILDSKPQRTLLGLASADYHIKDVAYDWRTDNIYFVQKSVDNSTDHSLMVIRNFKSQTFQKTISSFTHDSDYPLKACPHSLVVHSELGYLFYTAWNGVRKDLQRTATDGTGLQEIGEVAFHNKYRVIAIDYEDAKLYWIYDRWKSSKIRFTNLNGQREKQFEISQPQYPTSIYVHGDHLYIGNSVSIWRYDKLTVTQAVRMIANATQVVAGVRVVGPFMQASSEAHPCTIGNGGCQQFCFAVPQKKCECQDGQHIFEEKFCKG